VSARWALPWQKSWSLLGTLFIYGIEIKALLMNF
jgi:hypothetical protein